MERISTSMELTAVMNQLLAVEMDGGIDCYLLKTDSWNSCSCRPMCLLLIGQSHIRVQPVKL